MNKKRLIFIALSTCAASVLLSSLLPAWMAAPFALYFSVLLPGVFIYLALNRSFIAGWTSLVNVIGLGLAFLMFTALFSNWLLRAAGLSRPLTHLPLTLSVVVCELLLLAAVPRWEKVPLKFGFKKLNAYEGFCIASASTILLGFVLGAIRLNNGANGWLSIVCYILVPVLFMYCVWKIKSLRSGTVIYILWALGFGVLLSGWLRSSYVSGPDISTEYQIFQTIHQAGYWSIGLYRDAFNACLSVSVLTPSLAILTKLSGTVIFKLVMPFIYSFVIPTAYLIARKYLSVLLSAIAAFFFFAQPTFTLWYSIPIRQEVAFLFFGLIVLTLSSSIKKNKAQTSLLLIYILSMIVSHYSTAYIALGFFILLKLYQTFIPRIFHRTVETSSQLSTTLVLLMMLVLFAWYSQITYGFNTLPQFFSKSFSDLTQMIKGDKTSTGQFNIFSNTTSTSFNSQKYTQTAVDTSKTKFGSSNLYENSSSVVNVKTLGVDTNSRRFVNLLKQGVVLLSKVFVVVGVGIIFWVSKKKTKLERYSSQNLAAISIMVLAIVVPFFSIEYDLLRTAQQLLFVLAGSLVGIALLKPKRHIAILLGAFVAVYFILISNVLLPFTVFSSVPVSLENNGTTYDYYYVHDSDIVAAGWFVDMVTRNKNVHGDYIVGDDYSRLKFNLVPGSTSNGLTNITLLPAAIPKNAYVFADYANTHTEDAFSNYEGGVLVYTYPISFLNNYKNLVYSSGSDRVYR